MELSALINPTRVCRTREEETYQIFITLAVIQAFYSLEILQSSETADIELFVLLGGEDDPSDVFAHPNTKLIRLVGLWFCGGNLLLELDWASAGAVFVTWCQGLIWELGTDGERCLQSWEEHKQAFLLGLCRASVESAETQKL